MSNLFAALPAREGHFLLESGYHSSLWMTLDELFYDPAAVAPLIENLAERLRPHRANVVCGPMSGGAFLAHGLATTLGARFCYTEPTKTPLGGALFAAEYSLPATLRTRVRGESVAVVDDVISAGSSVRATVASLTAAGASVVVIGTFLVLGDRAFHYFADEGIPVETLERRPFESWMPNGCPLCRDEVPLEDPRETDRPASA